MQRVEEEIVKRTPKIEKGIIERLRSERSDELSEAESRHNREQVELINDLKQREIKHIDNINRLEKVDSLNQNYMLIFPKVISLFIWFSIFSRNWVKQSKKLSTQKTAWPKSALRWWKNDAS